MRKFAFMMSLFIFGAGCSEGGVALAPSCQALLSCLAKVAPASLTAAKQKYGEQSDCWTSASKTATCGAVCATDLKWWTKQYPAEAACKAPSDGGVPKKDGGGSGADLGKIVPVKGKEVDILFMVDNSSNMVAAQNNLAIQFPQFIDALKSSKFSGGLPNLRIGIVSSDVGSGSLYQDSACVIDGDKGKLQSAAMVSGCTAPTGSWIEHKDGTTNISGGGGDVASALKAGFSCIAKLGKGGCGFEQSIESVKRALDPSVNVNPGFLRTGALLVVIFVTNEDDCSPKSPGLFDPSQGSLKDPLGPLNSFRCFDFGVRCDCVNSGTCDRTNQGGRTNCAPATNGYFDGLSRYRDFFKKLKPAGQLIMASIAGPTSNVEVGSMTGLPILKQSCSGNGSGAVPAILIEALVKPFTYGRSGLISSICSTDYSPALKSIAATILEGLSGTK